MTSNPNNVTVECVTTFSKEGFELYGRKNIESFAKYWPEGSRIVVYVDDVECCPDLGERVKYVVGGLEGARKFVSRHNQDPAACGFDSCGNYSIIRDAVRFCWKVFAFAEGVRRSKASRVVWLDGDCITHSPVSLNEIHDLISDDDALGWFDRPHKYPETGFLIANPRNEVLRTCLEQVVELYDTDRIFDLAVSSDAPVKGVTDCHAYFSVFHGREGVVNLSREFSRLGHPVPKVLGHFLDHLKGDRKTAGRSHIDEGIIDHKYWANIWNFVDVLGESAEGDVILASCDQRYFDRHFPALAYSVATRTTKNLHIHVISPEHSDQFDLLRKRFSLLSAMGGKSQKLSISYNFADLTLMAPGEFATYCACSRFLVARKFKTKNCLIVDVDSIFMEDPVWPAADVGIFRREYSKSGKPKEAPTKVAAGVVFVGENGAQFLRDVAEHIAQDRKEWYLDQLALYDAYKTLHNKLKFHFFAPNMLDWTFESGSIIWTSKGKTKMGGNRYYFESDDLGWRFFAEPDAVRVTSG